MTVSTWLAFALGAGLGAPLRFLIDAAVENRNNSSRPRGTLVVNAAGSLLLGVITGLTLRDHIFGDAEIIIGTGFCAALTTFSTFAVETVRLIEEGAIEDALKNVALHASIAIGAAALGYAVVLNLT
jgi:CrcB protein